MNELIGEFVGTAILITLGVGVVANVILAKTKGHNSGWIVITFGWAIAVFVGVFASTKIGSGGHLNAAITLAFATAGKFDWDKVPGYIIAQLLGSMTGSFLVWLSYRQHFAETENTTTKLGVFCTIPEIRSPFNNLLTEIIGTFILTLAVFYLASPSATLGALDALPVALLVLGIGLSLGGPTGYAINPIRDFGPRLVHFFLPMRHKRDSDWSYAWIPIIGPCIGALLAAGAYMALL